MGRGGNQAICDFNYVWIKQGGASTNLNTSHTDTGIKTRHIFLEKKHDPIYLGDSKSLKNKTVQLHAPESTK